MVMIKQQLSMYCMMEAVTLLLSSTERSKEHVQISDFKTKSHKDASDQIKIWCEPCGKSYKNKNKLKEHNTAAHTYDVQMCEVCSHEFKNPVTLRHHIRLVHTVKTVNCKECNKEFKNAILLDNHMKCFHERSPNCICYVCGRKYKNDYALKRHIKKVCSGKQTRRNKKHVMEGKQNGSEDRYCKECDKTFGTKDAFRRHHRRSHEWGTRSCHLCSQTFKTIDSIRKHYKVVHKVTRDDIRVLAPAPQKNVLQTGRIFKGKRVVCKLCGRTYDYNSKRKHLIRCPGVVGNMTNKVEDKDIVSSTLSKYEVAKVDESNCESKVSQRTLMRVEKVKLWKRLQAQKTETETDFSKGDEIKDETRYQDEIVNAEISKQNKIEIPEENNKTETLKVNTSSYSKENETGKDGEASPSDRIFPVEGYPDLVRTDQTKEELAEQLGLTQAVHQNLTRDQLLEALHEAILSEPTSDEEPNNDNSTSQKIDKNIEHSDCGEIVKLEEKISAETENKGGIIGSQINQLQERIGNLENYFTSENVNNSPPINTNVKEDEMTDKKDKSSGLNVQSSENGPSENAPSPLESEVVNMLTLSTDNTAGQDETGRESVSENDSDAGRFCCAYCKKAYRREASRDKHEVLQHKITNGLIPPERDGKKYYTCNQCQDSFSAKRKMVRHIAKIHKSENDVPRFICDTCSKTFKRQSSLHQHLQISHGVEKKKEEANFCSVCSKYFATKEIMKSHKTRIHGYKDHVVCYDCGKYFKYKLLLSNHIHNVHEITNEQCKKCNKTCKNKPALYKHMSYNHPS